MSMNPPKPAPTTAQRIQKEVVHHREVIIFAAGIILGAIVKAL